MDVSIEPGATTLTRRGASSTARARVNPSTALPTQDIEDIPGLHLRAGNPLTSVMEASSASQGLQLRIAASFFGDEERNSLLVEENERLHDRYIKEINDFLEFDTSLKAESVVSGFIEEIKELGVSLLNKSLGSDSFRALELSRVPRREAVLNFGLVPRPNVNAAQRYRLASLPVN